MGEESNSPPIFLNQLGEAGYFFFAAFLAAGFLAAAFLAAGFLAAIFLAGAFLVTFLVGIDNPPFQSASCGR